MALMHRQHLATSLLICKGFILNDLRLHGIAYNERFTTLAKTVIKIAILTVECEKESLLATHFIQGFHSNLL